ncbi:tRNA (adenosine(37)-N6)-dimethylallyltransferase MiaA [bacterium]|nr:tRNA (adenosine(37)-N6)-dimethylallyltransferase MiaA [bacterium]
MKYISIVGPTASGKTKLAISLAKKFNCEIINSDSRLFYKDFFIGTDKPRRDKYRKKYYVEGVKHNLIDFLDPKKDFSIALFISKAKKLIEKMNSEGKVPIVVGGSPLYADALNYNYRVSGVLANKKLRKDLSKKSLMRLLEILQKESPSSYNLVDKKNSRRVIRAIELSMQGESISREKRELPSSVLLLGVKRDRDDIYRSINKRVDLMIKDGLIKEVKMLLDKYPKKSSAFSSIGYCEIIEVLENKISLEEAIDKIKIKTRHFAKRQITWYKRDKNIQWVSSLKDAQSKIKDFLN